MSQDTRQTAEQARALIEEWQKEFSSSKKLSRRDHTHLLALITQALSSRERETLVWTSSKPTAEGWYWWRKDDLILAVELVRNIMGNLIEEHGDLSADDMVDAEWAGPLDPPIAEPQQGVET